MPSSGNEKSTRPRHRASVACVVCRERRTRCVINTGEKSCTQCLDNGHDCIIKNDDQRRKPVSKAYVNLLEDKISRLEGELRNRERQPQVAEGRIKNPVEQMQPEPLNFAVPISECRNVSTTAPESPQGSTASSGDSNRRSPSMVHKILCTRGHVSFDQLAGRLHYFGPTTNCHIHSNINLLFDKCQRQAKEQERRAQRVLSRLPQATHDYLMDCFWRHYNSVIHVVHRRSFEDGKNNGGGPFYSGFLHICILAAGYRFADKQRMDIRDITLAERESILHREAKYMLDYEIEHPGGIPSIGALLLFGDLEVGCGRDNAGWLYSGMAYRLCFDVGLHLDRSSSGLSYEDAEIGYMTLWACVIYDRYWALFFGRPTALKQDDLEVFKLSQQFDRLRTGEPVGLEKSPETQVYHALRDLMELGAKITDTIDNFPSQRVAKLDRLVYLRVAALDSELEKWYARLPEELQYTSENIKIAPISFFLLHQQYYSILIMLHRQFAGYDDILDGTGERKVTDYESMSASYRMSILSRDTCTACARRIAQIFWQHRQRFDTRKIFVTGLQHAGNAATALVASIVSQTDRTISEKDMRFLECLTAMMNDMAETYQPAQRMAAVFNTVLQELKDLQPDRVPPSAVPARRRSTVDCEEEPAYSPSKRGSFSRPRASTQLTQMTQYPNCQFTRLPDASIPPSLSTPSVSDKTTRRAGGNGYPMKNEGFAVVDGNAPCIGHNWSVSSGIDAFSVEDGSADQASQIEFGSLLPGSEAPLFFSQRISKASELPDGSGRDYIDCSTGLHYTPIDKAANSSDGSMPRVDDRAPHTLHVISHLQRDVIECSRFDFSFPGHRLSESQPARWKLPNIGSRYTESTGKPDSIWNEIIS